jgi:hypothetical protein
MAAVVQQGQVNVPTRTAYRAAGRLGQAVFFGAFALLFAGFAAFGSQSPGAAAVLAAGSALYACDVWRRGLFVEAGGVRIVRPWRLRSVRIDWQDIARFEMRTGPGQWPVVLIRASDQRRIPVPTFPRPRKDISGYETLPLKVQAQVDELNRLLEQHAAGATDERARERQPL